MYESIFEPAQKAGINIVHTDISTGEGVDKAGSYAIQGLGTCLVERIEGSYTNVMGFPIERILRDMEVKGWLSFSQESA